MTTDSIHSPAVSNGIVRGMLLDAVTEELVHARGPAARAAVMSELIQEMRATVEWLHGAGAALDDSRNDELTSVRRLSDAARDHQRRMTNSSGLDPSATASESSV